MDQIQVDGDTIALSGKLTMRQIPEIFQHSPVFTSHTYRVDLSNVDDIDSAGLALLVHWWQQASNSSSNLVFTHLPENLAVIAKLSGIDSIFESETPFQ